MIDHPPELFNDIGYWRDLAGRLEIENWQLRQVVLSLKYDACWCNPKFFRWSNGKHSEACAAAHRALGEAE